MRQKTKKQNNNIKHEVLEFENLMFYIQQKANGVDSFAGCLGCIFYRQHYNPCFFASFQRESISSSEISRRLRPSPIECSST